jgi:hypothetical protein
LVDAMLACFQAHQSEAFVEAVGGLLFETLKGVADGIKAAQVERSWLYLLWHDHNDDVILPRLPRQASRTSSIPARRKRMRC